MMNDFDTGVLLVIETSGEEVVIDEYVYSRPLEILKIIQGKRLI